MVYIVQQIVQKINKFDIREIGIIILPTIIKRIRNENESRIQIKI